MREPAAVARALSGCPVAHGGGTDKMGKSGKLDTMDKMDKTAFAPAQEARDASQIPSVKMWPLVGSLPTLLQYRAKTGAGIRAMDLATENVDKLGKIFALRRSGSNTTYVVASSEYLKVFETDSKEVRGVLDDLWSLHQFYKRNFPGQKLNSFLLRGEEWRKGRMALNPYIFNAKKAKSYLPQVNAAVRAALPHITKHEENLGEYFAYASVDMFNSVALGVNLKASAGDEDGLRLAQTIVEGATQAFELCRFAPYSKLDILKFGAWRKFESSYSAMLSVITEIIERSLADPQAEGFLKDFLVHGHGMTSNEASSMASILVAAAADTTSSMLFNTVFMLSRNPEQQSRLRVALHDELQGRDWQADTRCDYLNWVLYESQRMMPALAFNHVQRAITEDVVIEGYNIPKGSDVLFSHHLIANAVDRPSDFTPERWSDAEKAKRKGTPLEFLDHPVVRAPFGFGPRKCVGSRMALLEVRALLSRLVQDYDFHFDAATSPEFENITLISNTLRPSPHIRFRPTSTSATAKLK